MSGRDNDPTDPEFLALDAEHRRLSRLKDLYEALGNNVSGLGEHGEANVAWRQAADYHRRRIDVRSRLDQLRRDHTAQRRA